MKYIKLYEEINIDFDDIDEEERNYITDDEFVIRGFPHHDSISFYTINGRYRLMLFKKGENKVIKKIENNTIYYNNFKMENTIELKKEEIDDIIETNSWLANNFLIDADEFCKWRFDEINELVKINLYE